MKDIQYQQKAIDELVDKTIDLLGLNGNRHTLVFKSPTGSGKTIMASEMLCRLDEELRERPDAPFTEAAFIWIAPNKLHEQSYFKLTNYFDETCALKPVMFDDLEQSEGIQPGQILFVNWESINKECNLMARDSETSKSLYEITRITQEERGVPIVVIIDEEHQFGGKNAKKSEKVLSNINPKLEIRISATPDTVGEQRVVVPRQKVIEEEMIKENIILNPALNFNDPHGNLNQHILWLGIQKREELAQAYADLGININPLLLIQLPNDDSDKLTADDSAVKSDVMAALEAHGITVANGKLAIWLSGEKTDNLSTIENPNDPTEALLFKQAIALGWDCPRAAVLVIFRKIGSFQFSAQTVGRILRMPEQKYYTDKRLNQGYVYTNLAKDMVEIVKEDMNYLSNNIRALRRHEINNVVLDSEYSELLSSDRNRLGSDFKDVLKSTFINEWGLNRGQNSLFTEDILFGNDDDIGNDADTSSVTYKNMEAAKAHRNINFNVKNVSIDVVRDLEMTGEVGQKLIESKASYIYNVADLTQMFLAFCKKLLGNDFEQRSVKTLAGCLKDVMEELFEVFEYDTTKIILSNDNVHHNRPKFERVIAKAIQTYAEKLRIRQEQAKDRAFKHYDWSVPAERDYPTDTHTELTGATGHALLPYMRYNGSFTPEKDFETFLEQNKNAIEWWYKNGDNGKAHYSIGYINSQGKKALFYVDYIIRLTNGHIYLFDTKKGTVDNNLVAKHNALIDYCKANSTAERPLAGGIIIHEASNWIYPPSHIKNTEDTLHWITFYPDNA